MSREQLVKEYVNGSLDRRAFIRRLAAAGVSIGAAASYAHLLSPEAEAADAVIALDDHYPDLDIAIRSRSIERVAETGIVRVKVECDDAAVVDINVDIRHNGQRRVVGHKRVRFYGDGGERLVKVPISQRAQNVLAKRDRTRMLVTGVALDTDPGDAGRFDIDRAGRRLT